MDIRLAANEVWHPGGGKTWLKDQKAFLNKIRYSLKPSSNSWGLGF